MLDAELDSHIDNEKHDKSIDCNYRNGHGAKKVKSSFGESEIKIPRDREGRKEVLGMWLGKNESSSFWMSVLTDLKALGVEDIFVSFL